MDNVVMTPHIGTATHEVRLEMTREACQNIIDFFDGKMPASAISTPRCLNPYIINRFFDGNLGSAVMLT